MISKCPCFLLQVGGRLAHQCHITSAAVHCPPTEHGGELHTVKFDVQRRQPSGAANHISKLDKCHLCYIT